MKVVCVIDDLGSGGAQRQIVGIAGELSRRGHSVTAFAYHPSDHFMPELLRNGVAVVNARKTHRWSLRPIVQLRKVIKSQSADAVLAFLETPCIYAEIAAIGLDTKLVVGERSSAVDGRCTLRRRCLAEFHRLASRVVTNSYAHREWMATEFPFLSGRLSTIWNGVDLQRFRPSESGRPVSTRADGTFHLVGVGRVTEAKNILRLIDAAAAAVELGIRLQVSWVGREEDRELVLKARQRVESVGLGGSWKWLGERHDIAEILWTADALISPSLWEGLPNAVCEALACGVPVLASDIADNRLLIGDGARARGSVFDPSDATAIASAIIRHVNMDESARDRMRHEARRFAEEKLSLQASMEAYECIMRGSATRDDGIN